MKKKTPKRYTKKQLDQLRREIYRQYQYSEAERKKARQLQTEARAHDQKADQYRAQWRKLLEIETRETAE